MTQTCKIKTPIHHRILSLAVGCLVAGVAHAAEQEGLQVGEQDVVRLASASPQAQVDKSAASVAAAAQVRAALYPNPQVAWQRQYAPGSIDIEETEDQVTLSVPVYLAGSRAAESALARAELAQANARAARSRSDAVMEALALFYTTVAAERRAEIVSDLVARLGQAANVLERRHVEGIAAGYEHQRLGIEVELARSELREFQLRSDALRGQLAVLLGVAAPLRLQGTLNLQLDPLDAVQANQRAQSRPSMALAQASVREARDAQEHADSAWIPQFSLTGGVLIRNTEQSQVGYVAGVSLALPVFSRGQEVGAETDAQHELASARVRAAHRTIQAETGRALAELNLAREELTRFESATSQTVERLQRGAEAGYREGHRTLVELLDAQRAGFEVSRRRLDLALAAKRAELAVRAATGEFE